MCNVPTCSLAVLPHTHTYIWHIHIFNFIIEQILAEHSQLKINCANSGSESFCKSYISLNVCLYLSLCAWVCVCVSTRGCGVASGWVADWAGYVFYVFAEHVWQSLNAYNQLRDVWQPSKIQPRTTPSSSQSVSLLFKTGFKLPVSPREHFSYINHTCIVSTFIFTSSQREDKELRFLLPLMYFELYYKVFLHYTIFPFSTDKQRFTPT